MRTAHLSLKAAALVAVLGLTLTACGGNSTTAAPAEGAPAAAGDPVEGGTFTFAEVTPINNWQTQAARFYEKANVLNSVLDRLTYFDAESGKLVGWIAEDFKANNDQTEFTFTIRDGVTFSDGSALDAEAVKLNLDALGLGIKDAQVAPNVDFGAYKSAEVLGKNQVKVTLKRPDANFLRATSSVAAGLVSPKTLKLDNAGQSAIAKIVGSGPFVFESEKPDEEVVFTSRDDYAWAPETAENQGDAYLDKLVIKYLPEVASRAGAAQSGQVDLVRGLQPVDEQVLAANGGQVFAAQGVDLTTNQAAVRIGSGKLEDVKVRQALQIGIDRQAIKDTVLSESYVVAGSVLNHKAPGFVDLSSEIAYNPEKSKQLLDEAGWKVGADGIREKDGEKLEITVATSNNSVVIKPAFELIEQQWRDLGVKLVNRAADNTFLVNALVDDKVEFFGTRQFALGGLGPVYAPANNTQTLNADEELNKLFAKEQAATSEEEHLGLVEEEQRALVLDKALALVLWDEVQVYGASQSAHVEFTSGTAPIFQGAWKSEG
ncbi:ABC transporter substrate-binding protein [Glutamicibacter protophormiae]|uniref:Peptide/nickel transport system substrate-binding protein n=1 Tax=Glutamicibacter protophormiae TaxID=37930 RepID=A0ABS4XP50_GLUPR|nr:ABC transporter substrate-binding protein [Glutamicibacter protophormiae]MBP2398227.1 peptide/nickel transport system substrate-binding protein [Glutamicibacter protophormiae]GGL90473.1 peptide ABC transporter substrate-binding protein [Glutamicibacter protophormiae]